LATGGGAAAAAAVVVARRRRRGGGGGGAGGGGGGGGWCRRHDPQLDRTCSCAMLWSSGTITIVSRWTRPGARRIECICSVSERSPERRWSAKKRSWLGARPGWRWLAVCCGEDERCRLWRAAPFLRRVDDPRGVTPITLVGGVSSIDPTLQLIASVRPARKASFFWIVRIVCPPRVQLPYPASRGRFPGGARAADGSDATGMLQWRHEDGRGATCDD